ncbi:transposase [Nonomuraea sp. NPDC050556]|uniref:transposase n=1 Tax=Nonomuraea sp. NPDC050556 TaxID=3364369 RepID=UPI00378964EE
MEGEASLGWWLPGRHDMREIVNAILCQARTGCQWRYLPRTDQSLHPTRAPDREPPLNCGSICPSVESSGPV